MPVVTGGHPSDHLAILGEKRLIAERIGISYFVHLESHEAIGDSAGDLSLERIPANERTFLEAHEAIETRLKRCVVRCDVAPPHSVGLLETQRLHRAHAHHTDAMGYSRLKERIEQVMRIFDGKVQLPS